MPQASRHRETLSEFTVEDPQIRGFTTRIPKEAQGSKPTAMVQWDIICSCKIEVPLGRSPFAVELKYQHSNRKEKCEQADYPTPF
jgi:hypothetical protein